MALASPLFCTLHSYMPNLKPHFLVMLLIVTVFSVYYPTLFAGQCIVDDQDAIFSVFNAEVMDLKGIFFPGTASGGYYRPLIGLSYWFDKKVWFLHEQLMHLEGVVFHLFNALLVFTAFNKTQKIYLDRAAGWLSLFAALVFGLHPVVTESVNWISGRTDVMMSNFILLSLVMMLFYIEQRRPWQLIAVILLAFSALLAKEAALGYIIGIPLFFYCRTNENNRVSHSAPLTIESYKVIRFLIYYAVALLTAIFTGFYWCVIIVFILYMLHLIYDIKHANSALSRKFILKIVFLISASTALSSILFLLIRRLVFSSNVSKLGQTVVLMCADTNYTLSLFLGAVGFYVKKFFMPLPLNFFIIEVDPLYDLLGIAVLLCLAHMLIRCDLPSVLILLGFSLLAPALPFTFGTIAWTAYAERYIYLSSAFWTMGILLFAAKMLKQRQRCCRQTLVVSSVFLVMLAAGISYFRNITWQSNATLMADTVRQSPKRRMLHDIYLQSLVQAGRLDEALVEYRKISSSMPDLPGDARGASMVGEVLAQTGRIDEALDIYETALLRNRLSPEPLVYSCVRVTRQILADTRLTGNKAERVLSLEHVCSSNLYQMTKSPILLLEGGDRAMKAGSFKAAYSTFDEVYKSLSPDDRLKRVAQMKRDKARQQFE